MTHSITERLRVPAATIALVATSAHASDNLAWLIGVWVHMASKP